MTTTGLDPRPTAVDYRRDRAYYLAPQSVRCPKCNARPGDYCHSTGGGNWAAVATHKARLDRVDHWTDEQWHTFGNLVWNDRRNRMLLDHALPDDYYAAAEAAAKPIPTKTAKQPTPRGVRLSENQAEEIEGAACNGGTIYVSTAHFHGDHQWRQSVNALRDKDILAEGQVTSDGYERQYTLTDYGWQVYLHHRLIIRRDEADRHAVRLGHLKPAGTTRPAPAGWDTRDRKETRP